jgi:UDP-3-O-[3-hydroxymyristoyl] glucosamine N-acyltransferase
MRLQELALALGANLIGSGDAEVDDVASIAATNNRQIIFVEDAKYLEAALASEAGAVIVGEKQAADVSAPAKPLLVVKNPRLAFARAAECLRRAEKRAGSVHPSAVVDSSARLGVGVEIGALAYIGPKVEVGARTRVGPGCVLLGNTVIGEDCELVARVTVYPTTRIGARAVIHAGVVLGGDGFGFVPDPATGRFEKFPQVGVLEIGDDVEIGANATIDRGALEATVIGSGVKLDNMVHVGHNAQLGENVVIAAQTGVSGSSVIEKNVLMGGQVGIADHVRVEEGAILGAQCGVPSKKVIRGKGVVFWGTPARPISDYLRELAMLSRLTRKRGKE